MQPNLLNTLRAAVQAEPRVLDWAAVPLLEHLPHQERLLRWIEQGFHADMAWLPASLPARLNPRELLPDAQSVVLFLWQYPQPLRPSVPAPELAVAAYAQGEDYHHTLGAWIRNTAEALMVEQPALQVRAFVDALPIQERAWAALAGLGWIGKHSLLIHPRYGSAFVIGGFLCNQTLEIRGPQAENTAFCGACTRCIDVCPTHAIDPVMGVDSRKCLSYLSIEKRGEFSEEEKGKLGHWLFGCDDCQSICPWNQKRMDASAEGFWPSTRAAWELLLQPGQGLRNRMRGTPLDRTGRKGLMRNFFDIFPPEQ